mmetsp:Transcript_48750/g.83252  ORF Transcript_48750/g.83252 Transcript_48750/m.83252 type:complete len:248 (+) Transcript_48750:1011-1754(+)
MGTCAFITRLRTDFGKKRSCTKSTLSTPIKFILMRWSDNDSGVSSNSSSSSASVRVTPPWIMMAAVNPAQTAAYPLTGSPLKSPVKAPHAPTKKAGHTPSLVMLTAKRPKTAPREVPSNLTSEIAMLAPTPFASSVKRKQTASAAQYDWGVVSLTLGVKLRVEESTRGSVRFIEVSHSSLPFGPRRRPVAVHNSEVKDAMFLNKEMHFSPTSELPPTEPSLLLEVSSPPVSLTKARHFFACSILKKI